MTSILPKYSLYRFESSGTSSCEEAIVANDSFPYCGSLEHVEKYYIRHDVLNKGGSEVPPLMLFIYPSLLLSVCSSSVE